MDADAVIAALGLVPHPEGGHYRETWRAEPDRPGERGDLASGERPQLVVPKGAWQAARPLGDWTLAGCTVSPAFSFDGFEVAPAGWAPGR